MKLFIDTQIADAYKSASQKARVFTENWVLNQIYCPNCGSDIANYENNRPVADFLCKKCTEEFGLNEFIGGKADAYEDCLRLIRNYQGYS